MCVCERERQCVCVFVFVRVSVCVDRWTRWGTQTDAHSQVSMSSMLSGSVKATSPSAVSVAVAVGGSNGRPASTVYVLSSSEMTTPLPGYRSSITGGVMSVGQWYKAAVSE